MNPQEPFDSYAGVYEERFNRNPLGRYQRERVHAGSAPYLRPGKRILDAGCGPGSDFDFFKTLGLKIDALDSSPRMAELAREKAAGLALEARIANVPLEFYQPDAPYDIILLNFGVINVFANLPEILQKLNAMLAPEGILVLVSMSPFHFFTLSGWAGQFRLRTAARRLFLKKGVLANGFRFFYYRWRDFTGHFRLLRKINLCPLLPNPEQYQRHAWARVVSKLVLPLDRRIAAGAPDWLGGDHVCYILAKRDAWNQETGCGLKFRKF